jgi:hypothetical protein
VRARNVCVATLVLLSWSALAWPKDLALISNKSSEMVGLTLPELVKVCKGQLNRWPDGKPVRVIMRDPSRPEMRLVLEKIYEMPADDVKAVIAAANHGRAEHPAILEVESDEAVVRKVESNPGAVGLVDVYSINGSVTVLKIGGKLPLEPGYPLHGN